MAKRFIDTGIFDDDWFMELSKDGKIMWIYLITKCDHAGMIKINLKLCKLQTGITDFERVIKELAKSLVTVSEHFYFIPKFIDFQYPGFPKSKVRQQESALEILVKYNLFDGEKVTVSKELTNSYDNDNGNVIVNDSENVRKGFVKPNLEEVKKYFTENGYSEEAAQKAFAYYDVADWHDGQGNQVKNWKQKMQAVWFKPENKRKQTREERKAEILKQLNDE